MIRALAHWLTAQARNVALDALGIREEVRFIRQHRREIEELRDLRDDAVDVLEMLAPRIPTGEMEAAPTGEVVPELAKTRRACPPPPANEEPVTRPVRERDPMRAADEKLGDFIRTLPGVYVNVVVPSGGYPPPVTSRPLPPPEAMHGAADGFGGSDFQGPNDGFELSAE